ncbi:hypothetical protein DSO57_1021224 [Entomophthora muscae]|uniref:Uncharacterized protein n=1 Tax=Entomophthora muscae TaxID=34485 RepID=A0ACC2TEI3_9FUNG|nr:hypothetical protein DSO57_1021224 [Entomophthora muscae]
MTTPPSWSLAMTQDTLWGLVSRIPTSGLPAKAMGPFERWDPGIEGALLEGKLGNEHVATASNYFTDWLIAWATTHHTATTRFIGNKTVACFGWPKYLIADGGVELVGDAVKGYWVKRALENMGIAPYFPWADGVPGVDLDELKPMIWLAPLTGTIAGQTCSISGQTL